MRYVYKRGSWYHFRRRVPKSYRHLFQSVFVQLALDTDSIAIARHRACAFNELLEKYWHENTESSDSELRGIKAHVRRLGFCYKPMSEMIQSNDVPQILGRIEVASKTNDPEVVKGVLGNCTNSSVGLDDALKNYFEHERADKASKSGAQVRHWENSRARTVKRFKEICGETAVSDISKKDILKYRAWWSEKVVKKEISADTANKQLTALRDVLRVASTNFDLDIDFDRMFERTLFKAVSASRAPFTKEFICNVLFDAKSTGMNSECQYLIMAMTDTGARVSELVGLDVAAGDICLNHEIPHIKIRPNAHRGLKTAQSERDLPLVGSALLAFQGLGDGFHRYLGKNTLISNTINKNLRSKFPSENHSLYSLRHSFEDRLTAVEPPDKVQAAIMGHRYSRPRYGLGPTLAQKQAWMSKIALL